MNRQCRTVAIGDDDVEECWTSYGNIGFLDAVRRHAVALGASCSYTGIVKIQTRDECSPNDGAPVFTVDVSLTATVLNPRLDTDKVTATTSVTPKRNLLTKFWGALS